MGVDKGWPRDENKHIVLAILALMAMAGSVFQTCVDSVSGLVAGCIESKSSDCTLFCHRAWR